MLEKNSLMIYLAGLFLACCLGTIINASQETNPIIDKKNMDLSADPKVDFYRYANGGWMDSHPLPADKSRFGTFDALDDEAEAQLKTLIDEIISQKNPENSMGDKISRFYKLGMNEIKIEEQALTQVKGWLDMINNISDMTSLQETVARMHRSGMAPLFFLYADQDSKNSSMVIAQLYQAGLGMREKDYYLGDDARARELRQAYKKHLINIFKLLGNNIDQAELEAETVFKIETQLASCSMDRLDLRDPHKTYHKMTLPELQQLAGAINWQTYFQSLKIKNPQFINVNQPDFFKGMSEILKKESLANLRIYLRWHLLQSMAPYLTKAFVDENFSFYGQAFTGSKEIQPRWKRVLHTVNDAMGEAVGQIYVGKYFPPQAKTRMLELVENLRLALKERITNLEWMSPATKGKAWEKLAAMKVKIGYPDIWRDYTQLTVTDDMYINNILTSRAFNFDYMMSKIDKPVESHLWQMTPQTVNAYFNPNMNEICFPAAILQPPFFYQNGDDAVNYGAIGMVIGHEMTHGFDDQGRLYDKDGNLTNWWTQEDSQKFEKRAEVLAQQYNDFIILNDIHADGKFTLGENIGDLGGLNVSLTALKNVWKKNRPPRKTEGFSPEQRFFLAYAHVWAQNITNKERLRRTKEDVHSLGKYRVIGPLRNMPEFFKAFGIVDSNPMYLSPDKQVIIW